MPDELPRRFTPPHRSTGGATPAIHVEAGGEIVPAGINAADGTLLAAPCGRPPADGPQ